MLAELKRTNNYFPSSIQIKYKLRYHNKFIKNNILKSSSLLSEGTPQGSGAISIDRICFRNRRILQNKFALNREIREDCTCKGHKDNDDRK